ncbi:MAG: hypothetical protein HYZ14_12450 [Bacteroidetes bacterium]|nr:hypothetical protein [Bacteroidota bacterium]
MSAIPFNDLKIIISQLSKQEISSARKFLVAFDSDSHKCNNKNHKLFEFLIENPLSNYALARQFEGGRTDKKSFDQICRRLKDRIAESLILDVNIRRTDAQDTCLVQKLYIRKKLLIASVLMERGAENEAFSICHKILKQAKEYELYSEVQEALYWMRNEPGLQSAADSFDNLSKELEFYRYCDYALYRARELYCSCIANKPEYTVRPIDIRSLKHARGELALMYKDTHSATIAYYYYLVEIRYNFVAGNFQACCNTGIKLTQLVGSHPVLKTEIRLGSAYVELARAYRKLKDYTLSLAYTRKAIEFLPQESYYFEVAKETEFKALYYLDRKEEASNSLKKLLEITNRKKNPWKYWKRLFYLACLNFSQENYTDTIKVMERIGKLKTDHQEHWNIGRRIVTILCKIEMNEFDDADKNIESLRKYLQRNINTNEFETFYKNVAKMLVQLSNRSYIFSDIKNILSYHFGDERDLHQENLSPDMKLFVAWFNAKLPATTIQPEAEIANLGNAVQLDSVA